ncbi:MAG: hypothetical protein ACXAAH_07475 [Promethearchaeota archaeon]|jgi:hypothetical protein
MEDEFSPEVNANFIILFKDEIESIEGWIRLEKNLSEFKTRLQEEIEYYWGKNFAHMNDYLIFKIDTAEKNRLKEIATEEFYQNLKKLTQIFIVILHKEIKYRIIENLPPVFEWFMEFFLEDTGF